MIKWIKDISNELLIAFIPPLCVALILTLPTYLVGWNRGYDEAEQTYKTKADKAFNHGFENSKIAQREERERLKQDLHRISEDLANLRKRYYEVSNDLKDTMTEMLKYKLELQKKREYDNIPPIAIELTCSKSKEMQ